MSSPTRVLFVVSEATPYTDPSDVASLARLLPEKLHDTGEFDLRIMMPRYGIISERKNRLHEVIRLSNTDIAVGDAKESLKVKVASIPGLRLQVYFMENSKYFKRKGAYEGRGGETFDDNPDRALFFSRAALATIHNLGWSPHVVHAMGWVASFVPYLIRNQYEGDALLGAARTLYTPGRYDVNTPLGSLAASVDAAPEDTLRTMAERYADAIVYPPGSAHEPRLTDVPDALAADAASRYAELLAGQG